MTVIAIIGSRAFGDAGYFIENALLDLGSGDVLISGGARGVDEQAEEAAAKRGLTVISLRPRKASSRFYIEKLIDGRSAGLVGDPAVGFDTFRDAAFDRNWMIAREAKDGVTACWDGKSVGTAFGIACAVRFGRDVHLWMPGDS